MFSELYEFSKTSDVLGRPPCWGNAFFPTLRVVINLHPTFRSLAKEDHLSQAIQIALWCTLNVTEYLSLLPLFQLVNKTSSDYFINASAHYSKFLSLGSTDILDQIILCYMPGKRLPWVLQDFQQHPCFCQHPSTLNTHWKDWCWSWNSSIFVIWCK